MPRRERVCEHDNLFFLGRGEGVICGNDECGKVWKRYRVGTYGNGHISSILASGLELAADYRLPRKKATRDG